MALCLKNTLALFSLGTLLLFYFANSDVAKNLSPQGCRMSWMSPSYVLQNGFDTSWSPLARRYSLWLYREVGWDSNQGVPILFIPGNAGSSRQVRSIASSATRQFYSSPQVVSLEFFAGELKPLDFFSVEFNEDLSAFHGSTIESQILYASRAVDYILSLYPVNTSIIIMGHSMGGIVATSLLPSVHISTIITMSTPHTLPPVRFDSRVDQIYHQNRVILESDSTPIFSLCGGAADMMIPSESCVLQKQGKGAVFRRTVFTSALEGAWTGVGHREMVWCHQVRWRVARAALEVGAGTSPGERGIILDTWLRDGRTLPPSVPISEKESGFSLSDPAAYDILPVNARLNLIKPRDSKMYLLPLPNSGTSVSVLKAVIFVSQGSIPPVSPQKRVPLQVTIFYCALSPVLEEAGPICNPLQPSFLRLIPNPVSGKPFPVPDEGTDESEGVVLYEADIPILDEEAGERWLGVRLTDADGRGWVVGGFSPVGSLVSTASTMSLSIGKATMMLPDNHALRTQVAFPNLLTSALLIYRVIPRTTGKDLNCSDALLFPLIMHTSGPSESHYYPVGSPDRRILLHTHNSAPYIARISASEGIDFVIYSSGSMGCNAELIDFTIELDWFATLGRWASRYPTTLVSWAIGVVAFVIFEAWGLSDRGRAMPTVDQSLSTYSHRTLQGLMLASFLVSFVPLPVDYYLGNEGEALFAPIAPVLLLLASGLVFVTWWVLTILMWSIGNIGTLFLGRRHRRREERSVGRTSVVSMGLIFLLIFLFVPWQVAYLGCWLIHLFTCSMSVHHDSRSVPAPAHSILGIPLIRVRNTDDDAAEDEEPMEIAQDEALRGPSRHPTYTAEDRNHNMHLLLLMTWLLPLAAPVLAAWVRTLVTAGITTPFDGDHVFLNVAPFLILVDFASWHSRALFERQRYENILSVRWCLAFLACTAFFVGPRRAYSVFDAAKLAIGLIVVVRIGRRYWGG